MKKIENKLRLFKLDCWDDEDIHERKFWFEIVFANTIPEAIFLFSEILKENEDFFNLKRLKNNWDSIQFTEINNGKIKWNDIK